ncbi:MAG: radical SAM protein [Planctomycetota bacterium]
MIKVLFTSVCRPIGPDQGDGPSVGYELLHGQVTREQGMFSPRSVHVHFSLEYIAENLEAPCSVLQYPSRRELIRELKKGYDYVGISFVIPLFHRLKEVAELVRLHSPASKIVLGGYGTVLPDEDLAPYSDFICREEGVGFMRRLLGEPQSEMPYRHPLMISELKVFSASASKTGMVFAGLGCPNGCDFCCTSHFFKRRHIKLLPTGADIHEVVERYMEVDPDMSLVVLDEDFLLNKKRAMEFRELVLRKGRPLSIFVFASIRAISQYRIEEIVEMGIDGMWIGYEGSRSSFAKQKGRAPEDLFRDLRDHGISILASMIVGLPYQNEEIIASELDGLLELEPDLCQFLIYCPTPGTPFYDRVMAEGRLRPELVADPDLYYKSCNGFRTTVEHDVLSPEQIEALQEKCFKEDFQRLGPSIFRSIRTWVKGCQTLGKSGNPALERKARRFERDLRRAYPVLLAGRLFGPNRMVRRKIGQLQRDVNATIGQPTLGNRLRSVAAVGMAVWTAFKLKGHIFQHPRLKRRTYGMPAASGRPARVWRRLSCLDHPVFVELRTKGTVWLRLDGELRPEHAETLSLRIEKALRHTRDRLVIDLKRLTETDTEAVMHMIQTLRQYRDRIRVVVPTALGHPLAAAALAVFVLYNDQAFMS